MNSSARGALPRWLPGVLLLAALLWLMRETAAQMVGIWTRSETFTHAFLVPPIVVWLAWRRRTVLAAQPTAPAPWLLLPILAVCFVWLLGELATVGVVSQFALVTLIVLSVPALFGWAVTRELAFPLAFLYFAVPFGEFTQPVLMDWTADFTVMALRQTGVPVYREGLSFVIPSGHWSVVEACSGVRYLIASFMVGTLFAYLNYRSLYRRLVFMMVAILVPIVANWLRAYMIVMIGHLSGNELAVGADHLIYGWVFFGIVIGLMFFIGARWAEPEAMLPVEAAATSRTHRAGWVVAVMIAALVSASQVWLLRIDRADAVAVAPMLSLPAPASGWTATDQDLPWPPGYVNPRAELAQAYMSEDRPLWLWVGYYLQQDAQHKLVSSVNRMVADGAGWVQRSGSNRPATDRLPGVHTVIVSDSSALGSAGARPLRLWQVYWVGGRWVASDVRAKAWQAIDRLLGRGDDGAVLLMATPLDANADGVLEKFSRAHLDAIDQSLRRTRDTR
jgi:exosortase A